MKNTNLIVVGILSLIAVLYANDNDQKLQVIHSWESVMKSNEEIQLFEKVNDSTYKVESNENRYVGRILLLNVRIEEEFYDTAFPKRATVQIELMDQNDSGKASSRRGYNNLYNFGAFCYSKEQGKWITYKERRKIEYTKSLQYEKEANSIVNKGKNLYPQIVLIIFLLGFFYYLNSLVQNMKTIQMYLKELIKITKDKNV